MLNIFYFFETNTCIYKNTVLCLQYSNRKKLFILNI